MPVRGVAIQDRLKIYEKMREASLGTPTAAATPAMMAARLSIGVSFSEAKDGFPGNCTEAIRWLKAVKSDARAERLKNARLGVVYAKGCGGNRFENQPAMAVDYFQAILNDPATNEATRAQAKGWIDRVMAQHPNISGKDLQIAAQETTHAPTDVSGQRIDSEAFPPTLGSPPAVAYGKPVCDLLPRRQVEAVVGEPWRKGQQRIPQRAVAGCDFTGDSFGMGLNLNLPPLASDIRAHLLNDMEDLTQRCDLVKGVGDEAILCAPDKVFAWAAVANKPWPQSASLRVFRDGKYVFYLSLDSKRGVPQYEAQLASIGILALKTMGLASAAPMASADRLTRVDSTVFQMLPKPVLEMHGDKDDELKKSLWSKAESGDASSQFALASLYRFPGTSAGATVQSNLASAAYWYQEAAKQNLAEAEYALSIMYRDGLGVRSDQLNTMNLLTKAAQGGDVSAMETLGAFYANARSSWTDESRAVYWLKKAIAAGNIPANTVLGEFRYQHAVELSLRYEVLEQEHLNEAMTLLTKAASANDCVAEADLGNMYFNGNGVTQSRAQAQAWFVKAATCAGTKYPDFRQSAEQQAKQAASGPLPATLSARLAAQSAIDRAVEALPNSERGMQADGSPNVSHPTVNVTNTLLVIGAALFAKAVVDHRNDTPEDKKRIAAEMRRLNDDAEYDRRMRVSSCYMQFGTGWDTPCASIR